MNATIVSASGHNLQNYTQETSVSNANDSEWRDGSGMNDKLDSVDTDTNTWVWLFGGYNFDITSTNIVVPPQTSWDVSDHGFSCKLGSFKVCDYNPNTSGVYAQLYASGAGSKTKSIATTLEVNDTNDVNWDNSSNGMNDYFSKVVTNNTTWVKLFGAYDCFFNNASDHILIPNNSNLSLDLDYKVGSFQVYDYDPTLPFDLNAVSANFQELYPGTVRRYNSDGDWDQFSDLWYGSFYAQDSEYRIYDPLYQLQKFNDPILGVIDVVKFTINLEHSQYGKNDYATVTFSMDYQGNFADQINVEYTMGDATVIPKWLIKLIDSEIDEASIAAKAMADAIVDVVADVGTDGLAVPLDPFMDKLINKSISVSAKALTFCVDHINFVLKALFKLQDDGGSMYFAPIVGQSITRMIAAHYQELFGTVPTKSFDGNAFLNYFKLSWSSKGYENPYIEFNLAGQHYNSSGNDFRCFYPDATTIYANYGSLCSAKIVAITNNKQDDYLILASAFDPQGNLLAVEGSADIFEVKYPSDYQVPASGTLLRDKDGKIWKYLNGTSSSPIATSYADLYTAFTTEMHNALNNVSGMTITSQQRAMVDAATLVLHGMDAATS